MEKQKKEEGGLDGIWGKSILEEGFREWKILDMIEQFSYERNILLSRESKEN